MGSVQFQIAPRSAYTPRYLQAPYGVFSVLYKDFNLLHRSLLKRFSFVYLASVCRSLQGLLSALTQAGGGGLLFRLLVPLRCGEGLTLLSPSTLLRLPAALYGACPALRAGPALGCSTKARTRLRLHSVPSPPERLRQPRARPTHSPRVRRAFSPPRSQPQLPPAPVRCVHFLPSASPAPVPACALCLDATLPANVNHPESQEVFG